MIVDHFEGKIFEMSGNFVKLFNALGFNEINEIKDLELI